MQDEWDKDYLNEHEPMSGVLSTLLEKHGAPRLALLCKCVGHTHKRLECVTCDAYV